MSGSGVVTTGGADFDEVFSEEGGDQRWLGADRWVEQAKLEIAQGLSVAVGEGHVSPEQARALQGATYPGLEHAQEYLGLGDGTLGDIAALGAAQQHRREGFNRISKLWVFTSKHAVGFAGAAAVDPERAERFHHKSIAQELDAVLVAERGFVDERGHRFASGGEVCILEIRGEQSST